MAKKKEVEIKENYNDYIIGIDISLNDSGVSVYSLSEGRFVYTAHCNTTHIRKLKKYRGYSINAIKLNVQREFFEDIKRKFPPKIVIFEKGFAKFRKEVASLNQINGIIFSVFWNYTHIFYSPTEIKAEILHGRAEKEEVRDVIMTNVPEVVDDKGFYENDNVSDAVAVLITYLLKNKIYKKSEWDRTKYEKPIPKRRVPLTKKIDLPY